MAEVRMQITGRGLAKQAIESVLTGVRSSAEGGTTSVGRYLRGRPVLKFRVFNDRAAFETAVARRFALIVATDAIDKSHVKAGECPCHGRIELRTTHRDLPGSRRTMYPSRTMRPNPNRFIKTSHYEFSADSGQTYADTIIGGLMISAATYREHTS